jgi:hypothetical protein
MKEIKTMLAITYVKDILQKEYDRHQSEIKEHGEQFSLTKSNRQRRKLIKHLDKLWEVKHIAELLGIILKDKDKDKELKIRQIEQELSIYYENQRNCENMINKKIKELRGLRYEKC